MTGQAPGERWYRRLLRLYPREFREDYGREMMRLYRDRRGHESRWVLWRGLALDLVRTAPSQHAAMLRQDLRDAYRSLRSTPVVTAAAMLTLMLGVGASTAIFSVVHAVLLRPLPYPSPEQLVELFEDDGKAGGRTWRVSALNQRSWSERASSFEAIGAFRGTGATLTGHGDPGLLGGSVATAGFFQVLGVPAIAGRSLQPDDEGLDAPPVVVLGESLWRSRFGGDRQVIGRTITLDGTRHQVVGVVPRIVREVGRQQLTTVADAEFFLPLRVDPSADNRGNHTLRVIGRLRAGVTIERAREEMRAIAAAMAEEFPATNRGWSAWLVPLDAAARDPQVQRALFLILGAVLVVLLIACANVANLLLARGMRRQGELAVRAALGAARSRLVRQLLTESTCVAGVSGALGVATASLTLPVLGAMLPPLLLRGDALRLDAGVLTFGVLLAGASGMVFGIAPALRASRGLSRSMTGFGRSTPDPSRRRRRQLLIVVQVALATMLLVGASLLLQAFARLQRVPLGFDPDGVLVARLSLPAGSYAGADGIAGFYDRVISRLGQSRRFAGVAIGTSAPFAPGVRAGFNASLQDVAVAEHIVSGEYFRTLGIPLSAGRTFDSRDGLGSPLVAVVSRRLASALWPETSAVGQYLERSGRRHEVVGVVGDVRGADVSGARGGGPDREPRAAAYFSARQLPQRTMTVLMRSTAQDVPSATAALGDAVRSADAAVVVPAPRPLDEWVSDSVANARLTAALAAAFSLCALLLSAVGIYGVLAYVAGSRTREIGLRIALGATPAGVLGLVLRDGMTWAGSGIVLGLAGAFAAANLLASLLFEIPARDPFTFVAAGTAIAGVALAACAVPAARAVRVDPRTAMQSE